MVNAIIVNYKNMGVGGIENYIYQVLKHALEEKIDIYWICDKNPFIANIYKDIFEKKEIKKVLSNTHGIHWFKYEKVELKHYEKVVILSFSFFDHIRVLEMIKKNKLDNAIAYYVIPHFTGSLIFPEQNYCRIKNYIKRLAAKQYSIWAKNGQLLFCANNHVDAIENAYALQIPVQYKRLVPAFCDVRMFDEKKVRANYRRKTFIIISAGRFEFPHKGYVLGLIDIFPEILKEFSNIQLYIVGDGVDKEIIEEKIASLSENVRSAIKMYSMMPAEQLLDLYQECNLSISVAGCASMGASIGLPTLPARHYTNTCEVYGFFPESKEFTTSTKPGNAVLPYIRKVIRMTEDEYVDLAKAAYDSFDHKDASVEDFICMKDKNILLFPKRIEMLQLKFIYYLDKCVFYLRKMKKSRKKIKF